MPFEFYWVSGSPNSWRAMMTLEYKQIPYVSRRLDPTKGESKTAEYLALNPRGKVPTLTDGNDVIHESIAIMAYLERQHPEPALFGATAAATGLIWQRIFEFINYARDAMDDGVSRPIIRGQAVVIGEKIKASATKTHGALSWLEGILAGSSFMAGEEISAADIAATPNIQFLARVGKHPDALALELHLDNLREAYPAVSRWMSRVEELPCFDAAYPPHWRET